MPDLFIVMGPAVTNAHRSAGSQNGPHIDASKHVIIINMMVDKLHQGEIALIIGRQCGRYIRSNNNDNDHLGSTDKPWEMFTSPLTRFGRFVHRRRGTLSHQTTFVISLYQKICFTKILTRNYLWLWAFQSAPLGRLPSRSFCRCGIVSLQRRSTCWSRPKGHLGS